LRCAQSVARYLIGEAWMKCCSTPIISTDLTFSTPAGKSWIRTLPLPTAFWPNVSFGAASTSRFVLADVPVELVCHRVREPSRRVGTAAEVVERVVRFVVRSTTDWFQKGAERLRSGVHKCVSLPEKASRGSRSSARRSYRAGRCARRANPIGRRRR
jgi:hypothetical protein